jgi:hypothetical protein
MPPELHRAVGRHKDVAMTRRSIAVAVALLVAIAGGCGEDDGGSHGSSPATSAPEDRDAPPTTITDPARTLPPGRGPTPVPSTTDRPVTGEVPEAILADVLADASTRTGVPVTEIVVLRDQAVTWPDGSLGCPEPGVVYTQALVPGYWVVLDAGGEPLDYRLGEGGTFVRCDDAVGAAPPVSTPSS